MSYSLHKGCWDKLRTKDSLIKIAHEHIQKLQVTNADLTRRIGDKDERIAHLEKALEEIIAMGNHGDWYVVAFSALRESEKGERAI